MATFVNNLRLKEITTGDEDGTWGTSTNTNLELITDAFGSGTIQLAADADETFTMDDGAADATRALVLDVTSAGSLTATRTVTLAPNTVNKVWVIKNSTTGGQAIEISQGSGANVTVANGETKAVYGDGNGSGAAVTDFLAGLVIGGAFGVEGAVTLESTLDVTGQATLADLVATTADINGGTMDGVVIGGSTPAAGTFTTLVANGNTTLGDASGDSVTVNSGTMSIPNDLNIDSGTLFLDAANNRVGVGTTSPAAPVHVVTTGTEAARFESTDAGSGDGPILLLYRNSASPADSDDLGTLLFRGKDDAAATADYASMTAVANDVSAGTEDGSLVWAVVANGTLTDRMALTSRGTLLLGPTTSIGISGESYGEFGDGSGNARVYISAGASSTAILNFGDTTDPDIGGIQYDNSNNSMTFETNDTNQMVLDSSGNLQVEGSIYKRSGTTASLAGGASEALFQGEDSSIYLVTATNVNNNADWRGTYVVTFGANSSTDEVVATSLNNSNLVIETSGATRTIQVRNTGTTASFRWKAVRLL